MHVCACACYHAGMRTTVEITEEQHKALVALARQRGLRGFSPIVEEALDAYLTHLASDEVDLLLGLEGSIDDDEEHELRSRIDRARQVWRTS
jgi:hypothetical protein